MKKDNFIHSFDSFKKNSVNETVEQTEKGWRIKTPIIVPKSVINAYIKKVKDEKNIDLKENWGEAEIAEQLMIWLCINGLNAETIPSDAFFGEMKSETPVQINPNPEAANAEAPAEPAAQGEPAPDAGNSEATIEGEPKPDNEMLSLENKENKE